MDRLRRPASGDETDDEETRERKQPGSDGTVAGVSTEEEGEDDEDEVQRMPAESARTGVASSAGSGLEMLAVLARAGEEARKGDVTHFDNNLQLPTGSGSPRQKAAPEKPPHTLSKSSAQHEWESDPVDPTFAKTSSKTCNCRNTCCLKLYCECFASAGFCGPNCHCINCLNNEKSSRQRNSAINAALVRNPHAFQPKVTPATSGVSRLDGNMESSPSIGKRQRGCNCRKSGCLKKYCECFQANVLCSPICSCSPCHNHSNSAYLATARRSELRRLHQKEINEEIRAIKADKVAGANVSAESSQEASARTKKPKIDYGQDSSLLHDSHLISRGTGPPGDPVVPRHLPSLIADPKDSEQVQKEVASGAAVDSIPSTASPPQPPQPPLHKEGVITLADVERDCLFLLRAAEEESSRVQSSMTGDGATSFGPNGHTGQSLQPLDPLFCDETDVDDVGGGYATVERAILEHCTALLRRYKTMLLSSTAEHAQKP